MITAKFRTARKILDSDATTCVVAEYVEYLADGVTTGEEPFKSAQLQLLDVSDSAKALFETSEDFYALLTKDRPEIRRRGEKETFVFFESVSADDILRELAKDVSIDDLAQLLSDLFKERGRSLLQTLCRWAES